MNTHTHIHTCTHAHARGGPIGRRLAASPGVLSVSSPSLQAGRSAEAAALPIVAKDLMIDPIQIAQAISQGADAVLLVASAVADDLPALLDACTLMGCEALVEAHTTWSNAALGNARARLLRLLRTRLAAPGGGALPRREAGATGRPGCASGARASRAASNVAVHVADVPAF